MDHAWVRVSAKTEGNIEEFYFMNTETRATTWERPEGIDGDIPIYGRSYTKSVPHDDEGDKNNEDESEGEEETPTSSPEEWWAVHTDSGEVYYMHRKRRTTTWDKPCEGKIEDYPKKYNNGQRDTKSTSDSDSADHLDEKNASSKEKEDEGARTNDVDISSKAMDTAKNIGNLKPLKRTRRLSVAVQKKVWVRVANDDGMDDVYYRNIKTGETTWDKPDGFVEETSQSNGDEVGVDGADISSLVKKSDVMSEDALRDVRDMTESGNLEAESRTYKRLKILFRTCKYAGSEAEWNDVILESDFALVKAVASNLGKRTSADVRALAGRILSFMIASICPAGIVAMLDTIGGVNMFWKHYEQSLEEAHALQEDNSGNNPVDSDSIREWSQLSTICVLYSLEKNPDSRPPESLINAIFSVMDGGIEQTAFLALAKAASYANIMFDGPVSDNALMNVLKANPKSDPWGEAIIYQLNEADPRDTMTIRALLKIVSDLYSDKKTSNYFYTNDLHVIVDILVRELVDLPSASETRVTYLEVLEKVLQNSSWFVKDRYRHDDISSALESIVDAYEGDSSFNKDAYEYAKRIQGSCRDLLSSS
eukprot:g4256.t1